MHHFPGLVPWAFHMLACKEWTENLESCSVYTVLYILDIAVRCIRVLGNIFPPQTFLVPYR